MTELAKPSKDNSILTIIYLMYMTNMIDNRGLLRIMEEIGKKFPDDITSFLLKEAAKAS